jgi:putative tricarboxylic transport membrane protein
VDIFQGVVEGFGVALSPWNLFYVFLGVFIGTVIGALPGLGPTATIALLLPLTFGLEPETAIIMLAGIYYGSMYGGRIPSILLQLPGDAAAVVTVFDGYPMARQGRAGPALGITAIASFIGGTVSVIGLTLFAPLLARFAVNFGPPEYLALTVVGILLIAYLGSKSVWKSLVVAGFGLLLATIGQDPITGTTRFTFGVTELIDGISFVPIAMGLFGVGEILYNLEQRGGMRLITTRVSNTWPSMADWVQSRAAIARGAVLGFFIGILPGGGGVVSSLVSYGVEKRVARDPSRFGKGAIEGLSGPETADNASSTSAFIPLLTLGIPSNVVLALLFGALLLQNVTPGPLLITENPEVFWGVIASMYIGNIILILLNLPLIGLFVQLLRLRGGILAPLAVMLTMVGVFAFENSTFDMWLVLVFGVLGYLMRKTGFEPGPLVLAFVLGPIMESAFRRSMLLSGGDPSIFVTRPISGTILFVALAVVAVSVVQLVRKRRAAPDLDAEAPAGDADGDADNDQDNDSRG